MKFLLTFFILSVFIPPVQSDNLRIRDLGVYDSKGATPEDLGYKSFSKRRLTVTGVGFFIPEYAVQAAFFGGISVSSEGVKRFPLECAFPNARKLEPSKIIGFRGRRLLVVTGNEIGVKQRLIELTINREALHNFCIDVTARFDSPCAKSLGSGFQDGPYGSSERAYLQIARSLPASEASLLIGQACSLRITARDSNGNPIPKLDIPFQQNIEHCFHDAFGFDCNPVQPGQPQRIQTDKNGTATTDLRILEDLSVVLSLESAQRAAYMTKASVEAYGTSVRLHVPYGHPIWHSREIVILAVVEN